MRGIICVSPKESDTTFRGKVKLITIPDLKAYIKRYFPSGAATRSITIQDREFLLMGHKSQQTAAWTPSAFTRDGKPLLRGSFILLSADHGNPVPMYADQAGIAMNSFKEHLESMSDDGPGRIWYTLQNAKKAKNN